MVAHTSAANKKDKPQTTKTKPSGGKGRSPQCKNRQAAGRFFKKKEKKGNEQGSEPEPTRRKGRQAKPERAKKVWAKRVPCPTAGTGCEAESASNWENNSATVNKHLKQGHGVEELVCTRKSLIPKRGKPPGRDSCLQGLRKIRVLGGGAPLKKGDSHPIRDGAGEKS